MTEGKNPLIEPENYFSGYNESMRKLAATEKKETPLDELSFNVFGRTKDGKKLLEMYKQRFLMPSTPCPLGENFQVSAVYYEGFREAFRQIISHVEGYRARKDYEAKESAQVPKEG